MQAAHGGRLAGRDLTRRHLAAKPFTPLPVLGVPGWWPANDATGFYDDAAVFRPAPAKARAITRKSFCGIPAATLDFPGLPLPFAPTAPVWGCPGKETMKRIVLFVLTNLAVVVVLGIVANLLGVNRYLTANGLNLGALLGFALIMGFGGAIISLLMSKPIAKWTSMGLHMIDQPRNADEAWIVETVRRFADKAGIGMPEVGIFEGAPNAFATGAFKNSALVAVSTGLLQGMTREEVEAVIGHEVAHIANGDMVTMTLIQGVMNTFVVFLSRVIGYAVDSFLRKGTTRLAAPALAT